MKDSLDITHTTHLVSHGGHKKKNLVVVSNRDLKRRRHAHTHKIGKTKKIKIKIITLIG